MFRLIVCEMPVFLCLAAVVAAALVL